jgi:hypothetical protein
MFLTDWLWKILKRFLNHRGAGVPERADDLPSLDLSVLWTT